MIVKSFTRWTTSWQASACAAKRAVGWFPFRPRRLRREGESRGLQRVLALLRRRARPGLSPQPHLAWKRTIHLAGSTPCCHWKQVERSATILLRYTDRPQSDATLL